MQYARNAFAFTKLTIHIQQIVFIFKNENILIQQNSYSHSTKIPFMHIQQKLFSYSTKITFTFNKNCIHIQQISYSYSTKIAFIFNKYLIHIQQKSTFTFNKSQKPLCVCHTQRFYKMADTLREEIRACVQEELQRIERTANQTSKANLVQRTRSLIEASATSASCSLVRNESLHNNQRCAGSGNSPLASMLHLSSNKQPAPGHPL